MKLDNLQVAGRHFASRLIVGTSRCGRGKDHDPEVLARALEASGAAILDVCIGRMENRDDSPAVEDFIDWSRYTLLPNTVGARTAEEAIRMAHLGREKLDTKWVKLDVSSDLDYLLPDPIGVLQAAEALVADGFKVFPHIQADPILARRLEDLGCVAVLPMASPTGTGQGIQTLAALKILLETVDIPVLVAAGLGAPSDAALALERGADGVVVNMAISQAGDPIVMAEAFKLATRAGRRAYLGGQISQQTHPHPGINVIGQPTEMSIRALAG